MAKRILLSGVFGPFGVDDEFGRRENIMELFHNQVTKAQGAASLRYHHRSFGLYFLAENVQAPVTVLDFPTREKFAQVLRRERFDAVGLSFIVPNFAKAREMARMVRELQPHAEIILGGHGAAIDGIEKRISCDHVVKGEGIRWLRRYLGEDPNAPIKHPALPAADHRRIFGIPVPGGGPLLVPGVGCVNACRFCCTSHFFGKAYSPYFTTGEELYRTAVSIGAQLGSTDFFVMDENFLKSLDRARGLLSCIERDLNPMTFSVFSSAEAIESFGVLNMVRLGVGFVWLGAESKMEAYAKNQGRDLGRLVRQLRDHGIAVLVSGIVLLEEHTPQNVWQDIDYVIGLGGDFTQFMQFTPLPGTRLHQELDQKGLVDHDLPFEEWHGQHLLNWRHPAFTRSEATRLLAEAFEAEYDRSSSSLYRMADTALRGVKTLTGMKRDALLNLRLAQTRARAETMRLVLPTLERYAHDDLERDRVRALTREYDLVLGPASLKTRALQLGAQAIASSYVVRSELFGDLDQPQTHVTRYRWTPVTDSRRGRCPAARAPARGPGVGLRAAGFGFQRARALQADSPEARGPQPGAPGALVGSTTAGSGIGHRLELSRPPLRRRKGDEEGAALAEPALGPDPASMGLDQRPHDEEPEPEPLRAVPGRPGPVVGLEHARQLLAGNPLAQVRHRDDELVALLAGRDADRGAPRRILQGVREQVRDHALEPLLVRLDRQPRRNVDADPLGREHPFVALQQVFEEPGQVDQAALEDQLAAARAGRIDEVAQHQVHAQRTLEDRLHRASRAPVRWRPSRSCAPAAAHAPAPARGARAGRGRWCGGRPPARARHAFAR
ncbi:MAG: cobalamin-dependent protein [Myxococcales bacterium]